MLLSRNHLRRQHRWSRFRFGHRDRYRQHYSILPRDRSKPLRRFLKRVDLICHEPIDISSCYLESDDRKPQTQIDAHCIDIHLPSFGFNQEVLLIPIEFCSTRSRRETCIRLGTHRYSNPGSELCFETTESAAANHILGRAAANHGHDAEGKDHRRASEFAMQRGRHPEPSTHLAGTCASEQPVYSHAPPGDVASTG
jgi:hypothetical protein